jgi:hypothetical protein
VVKHNMLKYYLKFLHLTSRTEIVGHHIQLGTDMASYSIKILSCPVCVSFSSSKDKQRHSVQDSCETD